MSLYQYTLKRIFMGVFVVLGVTLITFTISRIMPGDPVALLLGPHYTVEKATKLRHELGLDRSVVIQYLIYLKDLVTGDLGVSFYTNRPIIKDFIDYFPATLELTVPALFVSFSLGIPLGVVSAIKRNTVIDHIVRIFSLSGVSMPVFWLGLLLILVFYLNLGVFPPGGRLSMGLSPPPTYTGMYTLDSLISGQWSIFVNSLWHMILPSFTLGFCIIGQVARMTRTSMLNVMGSEYIQTARAKGLRETMVVWKHALRNALSSIVTLAGVLFGRLMAGAILTETIFSWPGIGRYSANAILTLDFQPIIAFTTFLSIIYVTINTVVDILYSMINPKVRLGGK